MARRKKKQKKETAVGLPWRLRQLLLGAVIGLAWGVLLWIFGGLVNGEFELRPLILVSFASAMIGGGVASVFALFTAKERGERVFPRLPYRRRP
jgi:uncharacterized membrane protein